MASHRVSVGTLETEVQVQGAPGTPRPHLVHALPGALLAALPGALDPVLEGRGGIIRIRRLEARLPDTSLDDAGALALALAGAIAGALAEALRAPDGSVASWPDREHYLADYLALRLGAGGGQEWAFADLAPLERLTGAQATVELAGTHPGLLPLLAERAGRHRLGAVLGDADCRVLVAAWHAGQGGAHQRWPAGLVEALAAGTPDAPAGTTAARQVLVLLEQLLGTLPAEQRVVGWSARFDAALAVVALRMVLPTLERGSGTAGTDQLRAALGAATPELGRIYREALVRAFEDPAFGRVVDAQAAAVHRQRATAPRGPRTAAATELFSPSAGVVLLVPGLLALGIHRDLDAEQLRAAVLGALWGTHEAAAREPDALADFLFPAGPRPEPAPPPPVPESLAGAVHPRSAHLLEGSEGIGAWSGLLLGTFASALPGLQHASAPWLRRQFLHTEGTLAVTDTGLEAALRGPDLAVVLSLAGLHGDVGPIGWLGNRRLRILLTGRRP
ncbi:hypothetical protein GCM10009715_10720 [Paeniglutamicibacter psychrophenolicus]|uniref:Uncharacterized protein n=1 Tax=Paeniglutamicibacter psychrophenolicus TaxID=257454 RepID=A0ABS4WG32_9MICC|nr:hypothetical protein [Paeniglutamicibacter psychrophenolicus]MBP2375172.1 hypothetical protein [Paeniglutamicibacter psychrophenolicus]